MDSLGSKLVAVATAAYVLVSCSVAMAEEPVEIAPPPPMRVTLGLNPRHLTGAGFQPIAWTFLTKFLAPQSSDRVVREFTTDIDSGLAFANRGIDRCGRDRLASLSLNRLSIVCRGAVVGKGVATVVDASSSAPRQISLIAYNVGGRVAGPNGLLVVVRGERWPAGRRFVMRFSKSSKRGFSTSVSVGVPRVGPGLFLTGFSLRFPRGETNFASATCSRGVLTAELEPYAVASGAQFSGELLSIPCSRS